MMTSIVAMEPAIVVISKNGNLMESIKSKLTLQRANPIMMIPKLLKNVKSFDKINLLDKNELT